MPNMSYCRFENTYRDLMDCLHALRNGVQDDLSERELDYAIRLADVCEDVLYYKDGLDDVKEYRKEMEEEN